MFHGLAAGCGQRVEWPGSPEALGGKLAGVPWELYVIRERQSSRGNPSHRSHRQGGETVTSERMHRLERKIATRRAELAEDESWEVLNDLAVSELERWRALESGDGLVESLEHIAHAAHLSERPETLFNLGLVLSSLELERTAKETWERFCRLADERSLPGEIRRLGRRILERHHRAAAGRALPPDRSSAIWSGELPTLDGRELSPEFADRLRRQAELGLLGRWATAVIAADWALTGEIVESGLAAGRLLARSTGDWLVHDLYAFLREHGDRASAEAHLALVEGLRAHHQGDYPTASVTLEAAAGSLAELGSPGFLLAKVFLARSAYYADVSASAAVARATLEAVDIERYPLLAGHLHWRLGVALGTAGQNTEAIRHYLRGRDLMHRGSNAADAAFVDVLLANEYRELGDFRSAWTHRIRAARGDPSLFTETRQHSLLNQMVEALSEEGYPYAARIVGREMVLHAQASGLPKLRMFAHLMRASSRLMIGAGGVMEDVAAARRFAQAVSERGLSRIELTLDTLAAQASLFRSAPERAEDSLTRAVETFRREQNVYELELTLLARAEVRAGLGDLGGARRDLAEVLAITEKRRAPVTGTARATSLRRAQTAFDGLVRIALVEGDPVAALEIAERSRARYLLETAAAQAGLEITTGRSLLRRTPPGTAILFYAILDDGTAVCWRIADGRIRHHPLPGGGSELARAALRYRRLMEAGAEGEGERALAARLYELLIAPTGPVIERYDRLVVVPDRELFRLPFSALVDPRSDRRLIESLPIVTVPSLSLLFSPGAAETSSRSGALLVVESGPAQSPELGWFPPLPGTRREIEALEAVYGDPRSVAGSELTEADLVSALGTAEVFHFAGHSIESGGQLGGSGLLLSRAGGQSTLFSLRRLPSDLVPPNLVYLSSCRSMGGYRVDREGILGLASFFFARGADAVVGTLWEAEDRIAAEVAARFHRDHRRGARASQALRRAVLDVGLDRVPAHTWANYVVMEKIRRGKEASSHGNDT